MAKKDLTAERLREILDYNPVTGIFTWIKSGKVSGHHRSDGYFDIRVDDCLFRAHRLAWLYMTGAWPNNLIDHRDRDPSNTRWANLRQATHSENHQNQVVKKTSKMPYKGIELHKSGLWRARLTVNKKRVHLGYFKTPEQARDARIAGEKIHFTHSPASKLQFSYLDDPCLLGGTESEGA